jgi:hypothetical protein
MSISFFSKHQTEFCLGIVLDLFDFCIIGTRGKEESVLKPYERHRSQSRLIAFSSGEENILLFLESRQQFVLQSITIIFQDAFSMIQVSVFPINFGSSQIDRNTTPFNQSAKNLEWWGWRDLNSRHERPRLIAWTKLADSPSMWFFLAEGFRDRVFP